MAVLIIYATKTGATAQCIKVLAKEIANCTICDIQMEKPSIGDFDSITVCLASFGGYKAYAAPSEGSDQLKGIFVDRIHAFSESFKK